METVYIIASQEAKLARWSIKTNLLLMFCLSGCEADTGVDEELPAMQYCTVMYNTQTVLLGDYSQ